MAGETQGANREAIAALRQQHIGRLLLNAHRNYSQLAFAKLGQRGHGGLSLAHINLFPHLGLEETRITTTTRASAANPLPARQRGISSPPCEGFLLLIPDSPYDSFKFVRIRKRVLIGEPATDASHLCAYSLYDCDGFLGCP